MGSRPIEKEVVDEGDLESRPRVVGWRGSSVSLYSVRTDPFTSVKELVLSSKAHTPRVPDTGVPSFREREGYEWCTTPSYFSLVPLVSPQRVITTCPYSMHELRQRPPPVFPERLPTADSTLDFLLVQGDFLLPSSGCLFHKEPVCDCK